MGTLVACSTKETFSWKFKLSWKWSLSSPSLPVPPRAPTERRCYRLVTKRIKWSNAFLWSWCRWWSTVDVSRLCINITLHFFALWHEIVSSIVATKNDIIMRSLQKYYKFSKHLNPGLRSRSAKESEVFEWSRIPNKTWSRIVLSDSDSRSSIESSTPKSLFYINS